MDTFERARRVVAKKLDIAPEGITPDMTLKEDLGADSLALVEIVMALEDEFGVEMEDEEADVLKTLRQVVDYIEARVPA